MKTRSGVAVGVTTFAWCGLALAGSLEVPPGEVVKHPVKIRTTQA